jgi:hypothetical protein
MGTAAFFGQRVTGSEFEQALGTTLIEAAENLFEIDCRRRVDGLEFFCVTPIRLPHRSKGTEANAADRALISRSQIARQLAARLRTLPCRRTVSYRRQCRYLAYTRPVANSSPLLEDTLKYREISMYTLPPPEIGKPSPRLIVLRDDTTTAI